MGTTIDGIQEAACFLNTYDNFVLIGHISPDGDTLGSCLALSAGLSRIGKKCVIAFEDKVPEMYRFLPGAESIIPPEKVVHFDVAVSVDCADVFRLGNAKLLFERAEHTLCIDHHRTNTGFAEKNCILDTASCGEIIVKILKYLKIQIDEEIATDLYTAITTDTGNLAYRGTTPETFRLMADVVESGIDISVLNQRIFRTEPYKKMRLRALVIENTKLYLKKKIGIATLSLNEMKVLHCKAEDVEGLIDCIRDIDTVEVAALLRECKNGTVRVSLRGKNTADVSVLAQKHDGGGHRSAAGCTLEMSLDKALKLMKSELPACLSE